jgi:hypothetical protein
MCLRSLRIRNFRSIEALEWALGLDGPRPGWRLIVGDDGTGKSSVRSARAVRRRPAATALATARRTSPYAKESRYSWSRHPSAATVIAVDDEVAQRSDWRAAA